MSDPESQLPVPDPEQEQQPRPSRLRRFFLRHVPFTLAGLMLLAALVSVGLYLWMSSAQFEGLVRKRLIAELEQATGGRVEIASFHWRLLQLEADALASSFTAAKLPARPRMPASTASARASACSAF